MATIIYEAALKNCPTCGKQMHRFFSGCFICTESDACQNVNCTGYQYSRNRRDIPTEAMYVRRIHPDWKKTA